MIQVIRDSYPASIGQGQSGANEIRLPGEVAKGRNAWRLVDVIAALSCVYLVPVGAAHAQIVQANTVTI